MICVPQLKCLLFYYILEKAVIAKADIPKTEQLKQVYMNNTTSQREKISES